MRTQTQGVDKRCFIDQGLNEVEGREPGDGEGNESRT